MRSDLFADFTYPGEDEPRGVVERGIDPDILAAIKQRAAAIKDSLASFPGRIVDCRHASATWERALGDAGVVVIIQGGDGVEEDAFTAEYRLIPPEHRSGFREADGLIHRHWWLLLGSARWMFDPTAHQFDVKGGVELNRYVVDGEPLADWRRATADRP